MFHSELIIDKGYRGLNPIQFGYQDCEPSHFFGPLVRQHWLLHYVESGTGTFCRNGCSYSVKPGEIFVIEPGLETYYEADSKDPWEYIWIGFTCIDAPPVELQPVISCAAAGRIFKSMKQCANMGSGKSAFLSGMIWQLMAVLMENDGKTADYSDYIEKAVSYMRAEYTRNITVNEIADTLNLNRSYFSSLFKSQIGVSPKEYLVNLRLEKAAEIMTALGGTPSVAAMSVGYSDIYQFSKMFKAKYGVSPREYIRMSKS